MKVLTICDRYNWGGASKVAKTIHEQLIERGHECLYLYGYDKKGLPNKKFPKGVITAGYLPSPPLNFLSYNLVGKNLFPGNHRKLSNLIKNADIVHIHNVHDYGFRYNQLVELINQHDKPVVITCHDSWYISGRCSLPKECTIWRQGCNKCPHMDYYHRSVFDFAKRERVRKLAAFKSIRRLKFVSPSRWLAAYVREVYGEDICTIISNSVDTSLFRFDPDKQEDLDVPNFPSLLLVANDFADKMKIDVQLINLLINKGFRLHIVGAHSPYTGKNVVNHGTLSGTEISILMSRCHIHLFMSKLDNQPLVVIESLCSGMMQLTFRSAAIMSMDIDADCIFLEDVTANELLEYLHSKVLQLEISSGARLARSQKYRARFNKDRMIESYIAEYYKLINL